MSVKPILLDSSHPPETVEQSLKDELSKIKLHLLHEIEANPSLEKTYQEFDFINNQQQFTLHITLSKKGIKCEYEDANVQFQRPAAGPIQRAVEAIFDVKLVSKIGEQAYRNILGDVGMFHHAKSPGQQASATQKNQQAESTLQPSSKPKASQ